MNESYKYLPNIKSPDDLKALPEEAMVPLAAEIRDFLINHVLETGGHLASNLGVVELSIALHRVFSTPTDHIIWDVGHQSYIHKIISGRAELFDTLRTPGGLSGFENRSESEHDAFGTGHSSTAISAAIGFAVADKMLGKDSYSIAVVGDGAFTGGMIHEALNNCARASNLIIILNENEMSISKNIGSFARYIAKVRTSKRYFITKKRTSGFVSHMPLIGRRLYAAMRNTKQFFKNALFGSNYFEEMGLFYLGPADGNDYETVERLLSEAKKKGENVIIHLKTKKGKGYAPAEEDPSRYHCMYCKPCENEKFHEAFGKEICELADGDAKICAISAAMGSGTGLSEFAKRFPDRYFDVGIAEPHALTYAAGLAAEGVKPYVAIYSTFLQRAYDNILHDICIQNLPVRICIDRASLACSDGATHHGIFDVAFLSHIPNITLYAPATLESLREVLRASVDASSPLAVRYPNCGEDARILSGFHRVSNTALPCALADFDIESSLDAIIVTYGAISSRAIDAEKMLSESGIKCGVFILEKLKPYGEVAELFASSIPSCVRKVTFLEEGIRNGGAGMLFRDTLSQKYGNEYIEKCDFSILAIDDNFAAPSEKCDLYEYCGISAKDVFDEITGGLHRNKQK